MFIIIPIIAIGCCVCMYCAYTTWNAAKLYHLQAESMIRMANERLYEADKIWNNVKKHNYNKQVGTGAKILPFTRHLKSVPKPDDEPTNAA